MATPPTSWTAVDSADVDQWLIGAFKGHWVMDMYPTLISTSTVTLLTASTDVYRAKKSTPRLSLPSVKLSILNENFGQIDVTDSNLEIDFTQFKSGQLSYGQFSIINHDGLYDHWATDYAWGDAPCFLQFAPEGESLAMVMTFKVRMEPSYTEETITFSIKGPNVNPNADVETDTFDGTVDEGGDQMLGKTRPRLFGRMKNVQPAVVNYAEQLYEIDAIGVNNIDAIYEGGYNIGNNYTDNFDGTFNLTNTPQSIITCDARSDLATRTGSDHTQATIFKQLIEKAGGNAPDVTGLTYEAGMYLEAGSKRSFGDALSWIVRPLGYYFPKLTEAKLVAKELADPSAQSPTVTYTEKDIVSINKVTTIPPVWKVLVGYEPLGYTFSNIPVGTDLSTEERTRLTSEYRWKEASDASVLTDYPNALVLKAPSPLFSGTNAATAATSLLNLFKVKREIYRIEVVRKPFAVWVGDYVTIDFPRYSLDGGKKFLVAGWDINLENNSFTLEVWG
jgi:hypothetical protein